MVSGKSESPQALTLGWVGEPTLMEENSRFSAKMFWVSITSSLEEPPFSLQKDFYCQCPQAASPATACSGTSLEIWQRSRGEGGGAVERESLLWQQFTLIFDGKICARWAKSHLAVCAKERVSRIWQLRHLQTPYLRWARFLPAQPPPVWPLQSLCPRSWGLHTAFPKDKPAGREHGACPPAGVQLLQPPPPESKRRQMRGYTSWWKPKRKVSRKWDSLG